jgi:hypothetical protein
VAKKFGFEESYHNGRSLSKRIYIYRA